MTVTTAITTTITQTTTTTTTTTLTITDHFVLPDFQEVDNELLMIIDCSSLVFGSSFLPGQFGLFRDLSAWQTRWTSHPKVRSLTK